MAGTKDAPKAELVPLDESQVEAALRGELQTEAQFAIEDPRVVAQQIINRILESEDADAVLGGRQAIGGTEILGRPFTLRSVRWHKSSFYDPDNPQAGIQVFAVLDAAMLDGEAEVVAVTTGSLNVMAQVYQLQRLGALPCDVKFEQSERPTANGFRPQWIVRATPPA